jgi:hypothetical protein
MRNSDDVMKRMSSKKQLVNMHYVHWRIICVLHPCMRLRLHYSDVVSGFMAMLESAAARFSRVSP